MVDDRTILAIYQEYSIPINLQQHMLRVAAVAWQLAESSSLPSDETNHIVSAALLHDMGNIIKFNLNLFPEQFPEGIGYWEKVKSEFIAKYGSDEHLATKTIAEELGSPESVMELVGAVGFSQSLVNLASRDTSKMIVCYADQRVTPSGVTSLLARINEGKNRFKSNKNISDNLKYEQDFITYSNGLISIEKELFQNLKIKPEDINDSSILKYLSQLNNWKFS